MNRSWLAAVIVVLVGARPLAAQRGEKYEPADGRFSVRFPGKPKESTQTAKSQIGDLKVHTATYAVSDGSTYMVSYTDFPEGAAKPEPAASSTTASATGSRGRTASSSARPRSRSGPTSIPAARSRSRRTGSG